MSRMIAPRVVLLTVVFAPSGAFAQHPQPLPPPTVLYPNPSRLAYPRTAQAATVSGIGEVEILPGKTKVEVKFLADSHWLYVCSVPSKRHVRDLKVGDKVVIQPDDKFVRVKTPAGKHVRLLIVDVDRWGRL